jgi:two-component system phosphate regulon sensor histidine kinase PhoR
MSRQIKIIWILSLISVLLLIGIQGYWLINQYEYVLNSYSEEIAMQVLQAGEEEFLNRKDEKHSTSVNFFMQSNKIDNSNKSQVIIGPSGSDYSNENDSLSNQPEPSSLQLQRLRFYSGLVPDKQNGSIMDTTQFNLSFFTGLTGDELRRAAERVIANQAHPFDGAQFDSILVSIFPGLEYSILPWQEQDTYDDFVFWQRKGNLLNPRLTVSYAYSPLENLGVFVHIKLHTQPVFYRMGIQLIVSVGITLLLIVCLIFQVRTILKQKKVNEIRENFVNTMVHELKRPVQTLKTFVSFLKDEKMRSDTTATEQVVRDAMFELDNITAYLNKLKDMLQADSETTSLHITRFNLQELVEKVIRLTHIPVDKEVTITPVFETDHFEVEADPIHFANVLSNLIENAIKYSGEKVHIELKVGQTKRKIWVSVKDDGIGIPVSEQESVFAKFYRGNNIPDKNIPGIGLGLSYVKLIVEAHQGNIHLNSQAGEGTAITIYLPQ